MLLSYQKYVENELKILYHLFCMPPFCMLPKCFCISIVLVRRGKIEKKTFNNVLWNKKLLMSIAFKLFNLLKVNAVNLV